MCKKAHDHILALGQIELGLVDYYYILLIMGLAQVNFWAVELGLNKYRPGPAYSTSNICLN